MWYSISGINEVDVAQWEEFGNEIRAYRKSYGRKLLATLFSFDSEI